VFSNVYHETHQIHEKKKKPFRVFRVFRGYKKMAWLQMPPIGKKPTQTRIGTGMIHLPGERVRQAGTIARAVRLIIARIAKFKIGKRNRAPFAQIVQRGRGLPNRLQ
jgi:hypothetical protein